VNQLSRNPYAAPLASFEQKAAPSGCSRDGDILVVPRHSHLPERCVKCNAPAVMGKPRTFAWHHPGWYVFILIALLAYAVIAVLVQKKAKVAFGLCESHRMRRRSFNLVAWGIFAVGLGLIVAAMSIDGNKDASVLMASGGMMSLFIAAVVGVIGTRILSVSRISSVEARLTGCGEAFLDSLPHY
jgi:hypothetical protein